MTVEIALVISGLSLAFGIYQGVSNMKRNEKSDAGKEASQLTTVIVKLENIGNDITEMKNDLRDIKADIKEHLSRIVKLEQAVKVLNHIVFSSENEEESNKKIIK